MEFYGRSPEEIAIKVQYTNRKGNNSLRTIIPIEIFYGKNEFHQERQWLMKVWDLDKKDYRTYALKDIEEWFWDSKTEK